VKKFKFKLESVLKFRVTLEELAKNEYREAMGLVNLEKNKLAEMEASRAALHQFYNVKAGSIVHPEMLSFIGKYSQQLNGLMRLQGKVIEEKEAFAGEKLAVWKKKRQDVKLVERLKEKKIKEYMLEMDKEDQKFQDDIFISKKVREAINREPNF